MKRLIRVQQAAIAREGELLTKERLCCGLNIFEMLLCKLKEIIAADTIWTGGFPTNGVCFRFRGILRGRRRTVSVYTRV